MAEALSDTRRLDRALDNEQPTFTCSPSFLIAGYSQRRLGPYSAPGESR